MYNPNRKQFIFKQSTGKVWNLYHDEKLGMCYSTLTKRNTWTDPIAIHKDVHPPFHADMDFEDNFHILYQDNQGSINYTLMSNEVLKTIPVLQSKQPTPYNKHLYLLPATRNQVHLFFIIEYNNNRMLSHQLLSDGKAGNPKVIDYVTGSSLPYSITTDSSGSIYMFYQVSDGTYLQLGYKKYIPAQRFWSEFIQITKNSCNAEAPRVLTDGKNIIHMCYQRLVQKQFELVYQQKIPDRNLWTREVVLHSSSNSFALSSLASTNNSITAYWVREDIIYHTASGDNGSSWSKPARYSFQAGRQLLCLAYKSNTPHENEHFQAQELPGSFLGGYKLAFQPQGPNTPETISADELKNMIVESLNLLKGNIEDVREALTGLEEKVNSIRSIQETSDRDLVKTSLKINLLENELNQLKTAARQMEGLKSTVFELQQKEDSAADSLSALRKSLLEDLLESEPIQRMARESQETKKLLETMKENKPTRTFKIRDNKDITEREQL
jgi:hypothetical protein